MAKRTVVGSICKSKTEGKSDYLKVNQTITLNEGEYLTLLSPKQELKNLENAVASGKLSEEIAADIRMKVEKIPDFVRFNVVKFNDENSA